MNSDFYFRKAETDDSKQLQELGLLSYGQFFHLLSNEAKEKMETNLKDEKRVIELLTTSTCFVCLSNEKIVGMAYVLLSGNPWDIYPANWSYIRMVGVNPAYSGKGIGKKLTTMCVDFAKSNNEKIIALHTSEMMDAARHIYESLGFKIVKELELRLGKRYWLYTKELEP
jgi:ribosomal protein S18 acetylase RimI-like enzyme